MTTCCTLSLFYTEFNCCQTKEIRSTILAPERRSRIHPFLPYTRPNHNISFHSPHSINFGFSILRHPGRPTIFDFPMLRNPSWWQNTSKTLPALLGLSPPAPAMIFGAQESFLEDGRIYCPNHSSCHSSKNKDKATAPSTNDTYIHWWTSLASVVKGSLSRPIFEQDSISTTSTVVAKSTNIILLFNWWTSGNQWRQIAFIVHLRSRSSTDSSTCFWCCCFQIVNISFYCHRKCWQSKCEAKVKMLFVTRVPRC